MGAFPWDKYKKTGPSTACSCSAVHHCSGHCVGTVKVHYSLSAFELPDALVLVVGIGVFKLPKLSIHLPGGAVLILTIVVKHFSSCPSNQGKFLLHYQFI